MNQFMEHLQRSMIKGENPRELQGTRSVSRAISLLRAIARNNETGMRLTTLARNVGLHVATARRLLSVLTVEGLIAFDPITKVYRLGIALYHLGCSARQFALREQFNSILEKIAEETEDTVFLIIRQGNDSICVDRIEGRFPIRALTVDVGVSRPLGIGAGSIAIMASLPENEYEAIIAANSSRYNNSYNLNAQIVKELVQKSQKQGYVVNEGYFWPGVFSLSVPVFGPEGSVIAAITVTAIPSRMNRSRQKRIAAIIKTHTQQVSL